MDEVMDGLNSLEEGDGFVDGLEDGLVSMDLTNVKEPEPVAAGAYNLVCTSAELTIFKKSQRKGAILIFEIVGEANASDVFHNLPFPRETDDKRARDFMNLQIQRALIGCGVDYGSSGWNVKDFLNNEAMAQLDVEERDDGSKVNVIKKFLGSSI